MAKLFDGANRYILFIQVLALLVSVCFTSPLIQSSENPPRQPRRKSPEGNAVSYTVGKSERRSNCIFVLFLAGFGNGLVFSTPIINQKLKFYNITCKLNATSLNTLMRQSLYGVNERGRTGNSQTICIYMCIYKSYIIDITIYIQPVYYILMC